MFNEPVHFQHKGIRIYSRHNRWFRAILKLQFEIHFKGVKTRKLTQNLAV